MLNFKIDTEKIDQIGSFSKEEREFRIKNLNYFNEVGFPNKRLEDWKFSDLREIVSKNFKNLHFESIKSKDTKIDLIKDFEHNYIIVENGELISSNFNFEDKNKIKIKKFLNESYSDKKETNSLINLNHALSENGYFLQVDENYKFKKILVIYHLFTDDLNENFLNSKNKIIIGKFSEVHTLDLVINNSKKIFLIV